MRTTKLRERATVRAVRAAARVRPPTAIGCREVANDSIYPLPRRDDGPQLAITAANRSEAVQPFPIVLLNRPSMPCPVG